jgi:hypothetical protein
MHATALASTHHAFIDGAARACAATASKKSKKQQLV